MFLKNRKTALLTTCYVNLICNDFRDKSSQNSTLEPGRKSFFPLRIVYFKIVFENQTSQ